MTALAPRDDELVVHHAAAEAKGSTRTRVLSGLGMVVTGVIAFLGWGLGARNGDAAFLVSQFGDHFQVPVMRYPGGGAAMVMGVGIVLLGVGQLAVGYTRRQLRWAFAGTVLLFVLAFLSWAATGDPANPISLTGLVGQSVIASIPFILGAMAGILCERSGVINIAIEGQLLLGAFAGALFASTSGSLGDRHRRGGAGWRRHRRSCWRCSRSATWSTRSCSASCSTRSRSA